MSESEAFDINVTEKKIFFALLRNKLLKAPVTNEIKSLINDSSLLSIYKMSSHHSIAQICGAALFDNSLINSNSELFEAFQNCQIESVFKSTILLNEQDKICKTLNEAKICFIPLKGAVLREFYPEPFLRSSCDIDVLIKHSDTQAAISALVDKLGYTLIDSPTEHDYQLKTPSGVHIELHYALIDNDDLPKSNFILDDVWNTAVCDKSEYHLKMTNEMFFMYHVIHMVKHFMHGGCGIRSVIDLWLLINNLDFNNSVVESNLKKAGLFKFYKSAVALAEVWFIGAASNDLTSKMEEYIINGGVFGTINNAQIINAAQGESSFKHWLKLIFLPRKNLESIYPNLIDKPLLYPYYQVKRWFRVFNRSKRNNIKNITDARKHVTKDKVSVVKSMLNSLDLNSL